MAQKLTEQFGKQFYVENIAGATGNIGTAQVAKAAPDGYTILFPFSSHVVNPTLFARLPYDPINDFKPVTLAVASTTVLTITPAVPAKTLNELIALIRANPGKYSFGSAGAGTQAHLAGEQFRLSLGLDLVHVPFGGGGPAVAAVVAGHAPISFGSPQAAMQHVKEGTVRALAVTSKRRSQLFPDVPTSRGEREGDPGRETAEVAGAHQTEREPDLAAGGPRQELAQRDKVGVSLLAEPAAANDELLPEIADVSDRAAEATHAELGKGQQDFNFRSGSVTIFARHGDGPSLRGI